MDVVGYKVAQTPQGKYPASIGIYDKKTGEQKATCTVEMRVYRPGYIIEGIQLSARAKRTPKLKKLKKYLESKYPKKISLYLKPIRNIGNTLNQPEFGILPKLGEGHKRWEIESLLEPTLINSKYEITGEGERIVEACSGAPDQYLEFERLCLMKGIADRLHGLSEIAKLLQTSPARIFDMSNPSDLKSFKIDVIKPTINDLYLINVEDAPALHSFPSPNTTIFISNFTISEYHRFHYSLRKEVFRVFKQSAGQSFTPKQIHIFANRIRVLDQLKDLEIYRQEKGFRFFRVPTNLLRALARYTLSHHPRASLDHFLQDLKKEFRIIVKPQDIREIYSFSLAAESITAFHESNFSMFVERLEHAGIVEIEPDGEVVLVVE